MQTSLHQFFFHSDIGLCCLFCFSESFYLFCDFTKGVTPLVTTTPTRKCCVRDGLTLSNIDGKRVCSGTFKFNHVNDVIWMTSQVNEKLFFFLASVTYFLPPRSFCSGGFQRCVQSERTADRGERPHALQELPQQCQALCRG